MSSTTVNVGNERQLILFNLGKGSYGIPIENVFEIKKMEEITVVPKAPKFIEGVINLRGNVVPVVDLRKRFGMEKSEITKRTKIIIVEIGKRQFGLVVDSVAEVVSLSNEQIEPSLPTVSGLKAEFINGIGKMSEKLIIILEISRILQSNEDIKVED
ncbi:MAG TPA: chemotaxis protein CheW [Spirochaetota bacterium]|jgi:purine-binding chemotaxis protein CheW|nr:MAG: Chemotaxis protein CheW [Spirochaetes bacterium ADurb.Bin133]HNZ27235.1 chemotaxis protein CheW [Spirochaetota bacterium]HPY88531.1 chemotaxis protein CheW [Spirochaetota bacterium]HQB62446.1 chemotaxis protein CheW [Spirochaetota bacterium]